jgi:hypothetical protein
MSIIASYITKFGIIQASDSNLTSDKGNTGFGQKVFPIPHLNATLAYTGVYSIENKPLDVWMNEFIAGAFFTVSSIEEFVKELCDQMSRNMVDDELSTITIVHIAGYHQVDGTSHCEHWHISNSGLNEDGTYTRISEHFRYSNDFNSRLNKEDLEFLKSFDKESTGHQWYINGYPPGRMSAHALKQVIDRGLAYIWNNKEWEFHPPKNIFEFSNIVKLYFHAVSTVFQMSDYKAMYVGGETQTYLIPAPQNLWKGD